MLRTYEAVLDGDHIEWRGEAPALGVRTAVHITVLDSPPSRVNRVEADGQAMAAALADIARRGTFDSIKDPVEWQREIRKDRPLPGREE